MKICLADTLKQLPLPATDKWPEGVWDIEAFRHGSMSLVLFTPEGRDYQTPYEQDELYIVLSGSGVLNIEGDGLSFNDGDVLFVPAGKTHCFTEFSPGIKMWAVFWGPAGGEST